MKISRSIVKFLQRERYLRTPGAGVSMQLSRLLTNRRATELPRVLIKPMFVKSTGVTQPWPAYPEAPSEGL